MINILGEITETMLSLFQFLCVNLHMYSQIVINRGAGGGREGVRGGWGGGNGHYLSV